MISASDYRNRVTIEVDNNVYQIIEFQHVKPGKGAAFVRTKLKNIKSGGVVEKTFRPTEKCPQARIDRKDMQYLYADGELYNFSINTCLWTLLSRPESLFHYAAALDVFQFGSDKCRAFSGLHMLELNNLVNIII